MKIYKILTKTLFILILNNSMAFSEHYSAFYENNILKFKKNILGDVNDNGSKKHVGIPILPKKPLCGEELSFNCLVKYSSESEPVINYYYEAYDYNSKNMPRNQASLWICLLKNGNEICDTFYSGNFTDNGIIKTGYLYSSMKIDDPFNRDSLPKKFYGEPFENDNITIMVRGNFDPETGGPTGEVIEKQIKRGHVVREIHGKLYQKGIRQSDGNFTIYHFSYSDKLKKNVKFLKAFGEFKNGKLNGKGSVEVFVLGSVYSGNFKNYELVGKGSIKSTVSGAIFNGDFKNWKSKGDFFYKNGAVKKNVIYDNGKYDTSNAIDEIPPAPKKENFDGLTVTIYNCYKKLIPGSFQETIMAPRVDVYLKLLKNYKENVGSGYGIVEQIRLNGQGALEGGNCK